MLYISRVTDNGYYITDTEDGVEEVVDKEQLTEIIELGLKEYKGYLLTIEKFPLECIILRVY